jgi:hypothetical protein
VRHPQTEGVLLPIHLSRFGEDAVRERDQPTGPLVPLLEGDHRAIDEVELDVLAAPPAPSVPERKRGGSGRRD